MTCQSTMGAIQSQIRRGEFVAAHANALMLLNSHPADYAVGRLFLQTAFYAERVESVGALLADLRDGIPAQMSALLNLQANLHCGDFDGAQRCLQQSGLTENSLIFHDCAYRIAFRQHKLESALTHLDAMERFGARPLEHFLAKFEILKLQGRYPAITDAIQQLLPLVDAESVSARWQLKLWQAGIAHSELRFQDSVMLAQDLIGEYLASPMAQQTVDAPPAKPWTRQRQHQVMADLERLILQHKLPVFLAAGSLLALVREGDFFASDKDIDLGVVEAGAEGVAQTLVASGYFDDISPPGYFIGYKQMRHRRTDFIVDIAQYQAVGEKLMACWRHPSGQVLREAVFPHFGLRDWDHLVLRCRIPVPDDLEAYLGSMYGNWRTPDPQFDTVIAACNLTGLTDFLLSLTQIRISHALLGNARNTAKALSGHLQKRGVHSELLECIDALP